MNRVCTCCEKEHPAESFLNWRGKICIDCRKAKRLACYKRWAAKNKERVYTNIKEGRKRSIEKYKEYAKNKYHEYKEKFPDRTRETSNRTSKRQCEKLSDSYIRMQLRCKKDDNIPDILIEAKRAQLKLKREIDLIIKNINNENT